MIPNVVIILPMQRVKQWQFISVFFQHVLRGQILTKKYIELLKAQEHFLIKMSLLKNSIML
jgi:hypothetical protein